MEAQKIYIRIMRMSLKSTSQLSKENLQELISSIGELRQLLSCAVCCKLLRDPYRPKARFCGHYVCRLCLRGRKRLLPRCRECRDCFDYRTYEEHKSMALQMLCYRTMCVHLMQSAFFTQLDGARPDNHSRYFMYNIPRVKLPLRPIQWFIWEGAHYDDMFDTFLPQPEFGLKFHDVPPSLPSETPPTTAATTPDLPFEQHTPEHLSMMDIELEDAATGDDLFAHAVPVISSGARMINDNHAQLLIPHSEDVMTTDYIDPNSWNAQVNISGAFNLPGDYTAFVLPNEQMHLPSIGQVVQLPPQQPQETANSNSSSQIAEDIPVDEQYQQQEGEFQFSMQTVTNHVDAHINMASSSSNLSLNRKHTVLLADELTEESEEEEKEQQAEFQLSKAPVTRYFIFPTENLPEEAQYVQQESDLQVSNPTVAKLADTLSSSSNTVNLNLKHTILLAEDLPEEGEEQENLQEDESQLLKPSVTSGSSNISTYKRKHAVLLADDLSDGEEKEDEQQKEETKATVTNHAETDLNLTSTSENVNIKNMHAVLLAESLPLEEELEQQEGELPLPNPTVCEVADIDMNVPSNSSNNVNLNPKHVDFLAVDSPEEEEEEENEQQEEEEENEQQEEEEENEQQEEEEQNEQQEEEEENEQQEEKSQWLKSTVTEVVNVASSSSTNATNKRKYAVLLADDLPEQGEEEEDEQEKEELQLSKRKVKQRMPTRTNISRRRSKDIRLKRRHAVLTPENFSDEDEHDQQEELVLLPKPTVNKRRSTLASNSSKYNKFKRKHALLPAADMPKKYKFSRSSVTKRGGKRINLARRNSKDLRFRRRHIILPAENLSDQEDEQLEEKDQLPKAKVTKPAINRKNLASIRSKSVKVKGKHTIMPAENFSLDKEGEEQEKMSQLPKRRVTKRAGSRINLAGNKTKGNRLKGRRAIVLSENLSEEDDQLEEELPLPKPTVSRRNGTRKNLASRYSNSVNLRSKHAALQADDLPEDEENEEQEEDLQLSKPVVTRRSGTRMNVANSNSNNVSVKRKHAVLLAEDSSEEGEEEEDDQQEEEFQMPKGRVNKRAKIRKNQGNQNPTPVHVKRTPASPTKSSPIKASGNSASQKAKPKPPFCRCGTTSAPRNCTCRNSRCPCYVSGKSCVDCKCGGCKNPHQDAGPSSDEDDFDNGIDMAMPPEQVKPVDGKSQVKSQESQSQTQPSAPGFTLVPLKNLQDSKHELVLIQNENGVYQGFNIFRGNEPIDPILAGFQRMPMRSNDGNTSVPQYVYVMPSQETVTDNTAEPPPSPTPEKQKANKSTSITNVDNSDGYNSDSSYSPIKTVNKVVRGKRSKRLAVTRSRLASDEAAHLLFEDIMSGSDDL